MIVNAQVIAAISSRVLLFSPDGALVREFYSMFPDFPGLWEGALTADTGWLDPIVIRTIGRNSTTIERRAAHLTRFAWMTPIASGCAALQRPTMRQRLMCLTGRGDGWRR